MKHMHYWLNFFCQVHIPEPFFSRRWTLPHSIDPTYMIAKIGSRVNVRHFFTIFLSFSIYMCHTTSITIPVVVLFEKYEKDLAQISVGFLMRQGWAVNISEWFPCPENQPTMSVRTIISQREPRNTWLYLTTIQYRKIEKIHNICTDRTTLLTIFVHVENIMETLL